MLSSADNHREIMNHTPIKEPTMNSTDRSDSPPAQASSAIAAKDINAAIKLRLAFFAAQAVHRGVLQCYRAGARQRPETPGSCIATRTT